jgi:hypothetical protein
MFPQPQPAGQAPGPLPMPPGQTPMAPQGMPQASPQTSSGAGEQPSPLPPGSPVTIDSVMRLLRDNAARRFRIDIEADSTIAGDESQEKQDRTVFVSEMTKMVETWGPIVTAQPFMAKLAAELMMFAVRSFRVGRSLEQVIEETAAKFEEIAGQPKPPPQPSPDDMIKLKGVEAKTQAEIAKAKISLQETQIDAQAHVAAAQHEMVQGQQEHAQTIQQGQQEGVLAQQAAHNEAASNQMKAQIQEMRFRRAVEAENAPTEPSRP